MKKSIYLVLCTILTIFSCSKETENDIPSSEANNTDKLGLYETFSPKKEDIVSYIKQFRAEAKLSQSSMKTGNFEPTDRSIEEALWVLEAALNNYYASPIAEYDGQFSDQTNITIDFQDGSEEMIDGQSLLNAYHNLTTTLDQALTMGQEIDILDVKFVSAGTHSVVFSVSSTGGLLLPTLTADFIDTDDDWKAGDALGKCDGTRVGEDGRTRLNSLIKYNINNNFTLRFNSNPGSQYGVTWTNVQTYLNNAGPLTDASSSRLLGNVNDPYPQLSACQGTAWPVANCVSDVAMEYNRKEIWNIINSFLPITVNGNYLDVQNFNVRANYLAGDPVLCPGAHVKYFMYYIRYAYPVYTL
ncbi:hypothetical protein [Winogradskyella sp.]|uniref:hypothetical protein n=1 Tax=Winogradskyella sp. TaxID=1883156 RepID=UPI003BABEED9